MRAINAAASGIVIATDTKSAVTSANAATDTIMRASLRYPPDMMPDLFHKNLGDPRSRHLQINAGDSGLRSHGAALKII